MSVVSYPLGRDVFLAKLPIGEFSMDLTESKVFSRTRGQEIVEADTGPKLWTGTIGVYPDQHYPAREWTALVNLLKPAGASFFCYDRGCLNPRNAPGGIGGTQTINSLPASGQELSLAGLPANFVLSIGDMLSFTYGTSPVRQALHMIVESVTADGSGVSPAFQVVPPIRTGAVTGTTVVLNRPACKAILVPGSLRPMSKKGAWSDGLRFDYIQTLR